MATRRGDWVAFSKRLVEELQSKMEVWMSIEDIKAASGTTMTIEALRDRGYWRSLPGGAEGFRHSHQKRACLAGAHGCIWKSRRRDLSTRQGSIWAMSRQRNSPSLFRLGDVDGSITDGPRSRNSEPEARIASGRL